MIKNNSSRIFKDPTFTTMPRKDLNLSDPVLVYNDGRKWKLISLYFLQIYPIVYDRYHNKNNKNIEDISITYCPYTSTGIIYFGKYTLHDKIYKNNIILKDEKNNMIIQLLNKKYINNTLNDSLIKRLEVKLMTLRNAMTMIPDCLYLDINMNNIKLKPFVDKKYFEKDINNKYKYHPKTIVRGIDYISLNVNKNNILPKKYSVVIGANASKTLQDQFDLNKSKIEEYTDNILEQIKDKGGIMIPCFYFAWMKFYPESKIIKL